MGVVPQLVQSTKNKEQKAPLTFFFVNNEIVLYTASVTPYCVAFIE